MQKHHAHRGVTYFAKNLGIAIGLVLIWRGIWYILDAFDFLFLGGNHLWSAIFGIVLGVLILYIPDKDLKELEKL
jgi:presenilin-like A22 family membrane protease